MTLGFAPPRAATPPPPPLPAPVWTPADSIAEWTGVSHATAEHVLWPLVQIALVLFVVLTVIAYLVYMERKVSAFIQARLGPMRVGPWGLLQPLADGLKLLSKEDFVPERADRVVFLAAPVIAVAAALALLALLPFGAAWATIADVNVGVLLVLSVSSISVLGIVLAGWASNSKYSLLGAVRSSAQMVSYEVAMGLALVGPLMFAGTLSLAGVIDAQRMMGLPLVFVQPLAFLVYFVASLAETNRAPFDLPESESEIVAGFHTEYSGFRWALFFMAEYANLLVVATIASTVFLGGWWVPGFEWVVSTIAGAFGAGERSAGYSIVFTLLSIGVFAAKTFLLMYAYMWIRWTLPRYRYDQLMDLGWKWLIPTALANVVVTGVLFVVALVPWQGGILGFVESTERGLVVNGWIGTIALVGSAFAVAVPFVWLVLARINRKTAGFNLHARRELQIRLREERLASAGVAQAAGGGKA